MKNKYLTLVTAYTFFMFSTSCVYASDAIYECENLLDRFKIDYKTKSYKGWLRVCRNNKLHLYSNENYITDYYENNICNCFKNIEKTRAVEVIKEVK